MSEIHEFWRGHWKSVEASMLEEVRKSPSGSVRQDVANVFYLRASHMNRLISEHETALSFLPWSFYRMQAESIASRINHP